MRVLNLYAGIGGNRKLWPANCQVTAVENNPEVAEVYKENFPDDNIVIADAHQYLLEHYKEYDFIWSSPPCQTHTILNKATRHEIVRYPDMKLYQEILFLQSFAKCKWVVENVEPYYSPLIKGKAMSRHMFWSNFIIPYIGLASPKDFSRASKKEMLKWLGLKCSKNIYLDGNHDPAQVLRNCVYPKLGKHVFDSAFKDKQQTLEAPR